MSDLISVCSNCKCSMPGIPLNSEITVCENCRKFLHDNRISLPITLETQSLTEEGVKAFIEDFELAVFKILENGDKIPQTDEGWKLLEKIFTESYEKIVSKKHITIDVEVEL